MPSREAVNANFLKSWAWPDTGIEPASTAPEADVLSSWPSDLFYSSAIRFTISLLWRWNVAFNWSFYSSSAFSLLFIDPLSVVKEVESRSVKNDRCKILLLISHLVCFVLSCKIVWLFCCTLELKVLFQLRDIELNPVVNRDLSRRVRPISGIAQHSTCARSDLKNVVRLIMHLDQKWKLWTTEVRS